MVKTNYNIFMRTKQFWTKRLSFFLLLFILGSVVFLDRYNVLEKPKNLLYSTLTPLQGVVYRLGGNSGGVMRDLFSFGILRKENNELRLLNERLISENTRLKEVGVENRFLRKQLEIPLEKDYSLELAFVVGAGVDSNYQKISLDKGSNNKVRKGDAVITSGNILVGRVNNVYDNRSEVVLVNNSESRIPVFLQESRSQGVVKGEHGTEIVLDFVPIGSEIKEGEKVMSLGMENIPAGLLIGEVQSVNHSPGDLFKKATVRPLTRFTNIDRVFIVTQ